MFDQITILGPGLLGASLAMALKERALCRRIHTWSRSAPTRAQAAQAAWCDAVFERPEEACQESDCVVVCTPVETIVPLLSQVAPELAAGALVTDVGSTKSLICRQVRALPGHFHFIGSHPMAGSEQAGMAHARADLFEGAVGILTPFDDDDHAILLRLEKFWRAVGMETFTTSPEHHDEIVARISHLPHVLASSLCSYLSGQDTSWSALAGGGLRDSTRIASGDAKLWKQILQQNREEVLRAIGGFEDELHLLKSALLNQDDAEVLRILNRGKEFRDQL
jgi:prephenate dehydrogenase